MRLSMNVLKLPLGIGLACFGCDSTASSGYVLEMEVKIKIFSWDTELNLFDFRIVLPSVYVSAV